MSGLLLAGAFAGLPFLAWFGLVPLLGSLERRRGSARGLVMEGAVFGIVLAVAALPWHSVASLAGLPGALPALLGDALRALPGWGIFAAAGAAFSLAGGRLLEARPIVLAPGIAALWTGIEALRGFCPAAISPWAGGWLALGHAIPAESSEAAVARAVGVSGLSLAAALSSSLLYLAIRRGAPGMGSSALLARVLLASAALAMPLACRVAGAAVPRVVEETRGTAAVLSAPGGDRDGILALVSALRLESPALVVLPALEDRAADLEAVRAAAARGDALVAGSDYTIIARQAASGPDESFAQLGARRMGVVHGAWTPAGRSRALRRLAAGGAEALAVVCPPPPGGPRAAAADLALDAYSAIECGRSILRSGRGARILDTRGRTLGAISPGLEGSVASGLALSTGTTLHTRAGWLLGPILAACAAAAILGSLTGRGPWRR